MQVENFVKGFFALWIVWTLFCLACTAGIVYVIVHFVTKYW